MARTPILVLAMFGVLLQYGCRSSKKPEGPTIDQLREQLKAPDAKTRREAAEAIGKRGPAAAEATPDLATALVDADDGVRAKAANALWAFGPSAKGAVPSLINALK